MTATSTASLLIQVFSEGFAMTASSGSQFAWSLIGSLWTSYWPYITTFLVGWAIWEVITRNKGIHYDSKNGFSPDFNRFVGSGTYFGLQLIVLLIIQWLFGIDVYLKFWPYPFHLITFLFTGRLLRWVGFWIY